MPDSWNPWPARQQVEHEVTLARPYYSLIIRLILESIQGQGRTKKEAKTDAAKKTLLALIGKSEDEVDDEAAEGKCIIDSFGRKVTIKDDDRYGVDPKIRDMI